jgi:nitrous oxidase accessory protein NosD
MKRWRLALSFFVSVFAVAPRSVSAQQTDPKPNILVDDDKVQCPSAQYTTIQAAVNHANSGDVIRVCAGTYPEQVTISKPLTLRADNGVVVIPSNVTQNATDVSDSTAMAAVFFVQGVQDVDLSGFIVDGSNNGLAGCSPSLVGILYQNASGRVRHNAVRHMVLPASLNGCQSGNGIEVQTATGLSSNVTIADNSIWDYQKNGITANDQGTQADLESNVVSGVGPTTGAASNGIQIGFGASGKVTGNTVTDNVWSPCVSPTACETNATGILIYESNGISIENNSLATNQIGIFVLGDNCIAVSNAVSNSVTLIGLALVGNGNSAARNTLAHADQAGVYIQGNNNSVIGNSITDAGVGILKVSGSTGNTIMGNRFFATLVTVQDPAAARPNTVKPMH